MQTYYLEFRAQQGSGWDAGSPGGEKKICFWVVDRDPDGALRRAHHYLVQNGWQVAGLKRPPTACRQPTGDGDQQEAACYEQAQRYGIAMAVAEK